MLTGISKGLLKTLKKKSVSKRKNHELFYISIVTYEGTLIGLNFSKKIIVLGQRLVSKWRA